MDSLIYQLHRININKLECKEQYSIRRVHNAYSININKLECKGSRKKISLSLTFVLI